MNLKPVLHSSQIAATDYDAATQTLYIQFHLKNKKEYPNT